MSPESSEGEQLTHVQVDTLEDLVMQSVDGVMTQTAQAYANAWRLAGIDISDTSALETVRQLDASQTYIARAPEKSVIGALHTVAVHTTGIQDFFLQWPTHESILAQARMKNQIPNKIPATARVCFSLAVPVPYRIQHDGRPKGMTVAEALLDQLPGERPVAYSKVASVDGDLVEQVQSGMNEPRLLGPAGLHEHLGAIIVAVFRGSRPEDMRGGGGNVIAVYGQNSEEKQELAEWKARRLADGIPFEQTARYGAASLWQATDIPDILARAE